MKNNLLLTTFLIAVSISCGYAQTGSDKTEIENTANQENNTRTVDEAKTEFYLIKLIDELESTFEVVLDNSDNSIKLSLSTHQNVNPFSISLKDSQGNYVIDGNLSPNTSQQFDINKTDSENYLLRISDMQTLKTAVYKIVLNDKINDLSKLQQ